MTRSKILVFFGLLILLAPFLGLPISWLEIILPIFGLVIAGLGYSFRERHESASPETPAQETVLA